MIEGLLPVLAKPDIGKVRLYYEDRLAKVRVGIYASRAGLTRFS